MAAYPTQAYAHIHICTVGVHDRPLDPCGCMRYSLSIVYHRIRELHGHYGFACMRFDFFVDACPLGHPQIKFDCLLSMSQLIVHPRLEHFAITQTINELCATNVEAIKFMEEVGLVPSRYSDCEVQFKVQCFKKKRQ